MSTPRKSAPKAAAAKKPVTKATTAKKPADRKPAAKKSVATASAASDPQADQSVLVHEMPDGTKREISLIIDLDEMFDLIEAIQAIDDNADAFDTMRALRKIMPDSFREQVKGVDAPVALELFIRWVNSMGGRLGKALTSLPA